MLCILFQKTFSIFLLNNAVSEGIYNFSKQQQARSERGWTEKQKLNKPPELMLKYKKKQKGVSEAVQESKLCRLMLW